MLVSRFITVLLVIFGLVTSLGAQPADAYPQIGVADNSPNVFSDPNYQALNTKISRKVLSWDFAKRPDELANMDQWVAAASMAGVEPLVTFASYPPSKFKLLSVKEYERTLRFVLARYPSVRTISPWNEANHQTAPTYRHPKRAAQYFNATRKICKGCKIVAADLLDQKNIWPWLKTFKKTAKAPRIWGLHNYKDANDNLQWRRSSTRRFLARTKGEVWMTEVGGIVAFGAHRLYDEQRGVTGTTATLRLANLSPRIKRVYFYSWYGTDHGWNKGHPPYKWDSGLTSSRGVPRPAYWALKEYLDTHAH